jgi:two-component system response regulator
MKGNRIIYLIDDDSSDLELIQTIISREFPSVSSISFMDGMEAVQTMKQSSNKKNQSLPGLILMDLKMPKNDGFEILSKLRNNDELDSIPVVIFSSSKISSDVHKCYKLGANAYVSKPVDFDIFAEVLKSTLHFWIEVCQLLND